MADDIPPTPQGMTPSMGSRNPYNPNEGAPFEVWGPHPDYRDSTGKPVIARKSKNISTLKGARRSADRLDQEYGASAHTIVDSTGRSRI